MKKKQIFLLLSVALATGLFGCSSVQKTSYLTDYSQMKDGKHLEKVMVSPELSSRQDFAILIENPNIDYVVEKDAPLTTSSRDYFRDAMQRRLRTIAGLETVRSIELLKDSARGYLVLKTAITRLDPGSRLTRWFAGELGAGHSHVQVEGELMDPATNTVLMKFSDQRSGSAFSGMDPTGGSSTQLIEADLDGIAKAISETLADHRK